MPLSLESLFDRLKNWFPRTGAEIEARASKLEAQLTQTDDEFQSLSQEEKRRWRQKIEGLSSPSSQRAAVRSALEAAVEEWQIDRANRNSLVILASPIEPLEGIWEEVFETWQGKTDYQVRMMQRSTRPQDCSQIADQLQEQLAIWDESKDDRPEIIVVPHLEWYFLRTVEGLDGIECLQRSIVENPDRFWALGCNSWAWQYLDLVCQTGAYCDRTLCLPELEAVEMKDWLESICEGLRFDDEVPDEDDDDSDTWEDKQDNWESRAEFIYFKKLQKTARGLSRVAIELWLASLCVDVNSSDADSEDSENAKDTAPQARRECIDLPDRPFLSQADRYLIYSVLLHGAIDSSHLALSVGEPEPQIQAQARILGRSGVLWNHQSKIQVNPAYYLRLKTDLENNKFLVGEDASDG